MHDLIPSYMILPFELHCCISIWFEDRFIHKGNVFTGSLTLSFFNMQCLNDQLNTVMPGISHITQYFCTNLYGTRVSLFFWGTIPFSTIFYPVNQLVCYVLLNMNLTVCCQTLGTPLVFVRRLSVSGCGMYSKP